MATKNVVEQITSYLDSNHFVYTYHEEGQFFFLGFKLSGKLQTVSVFINIGDDEYVVNATLPLKVGSESLSDMALLFAAINYRLLKGSFNIDLSDGTLQYKVYEKCYSEELNEQQIKDSIMIPVAMIDDHSESILSVIFKTRPIGEIINDLSLKDTRTE